MRPRDTLEHLGLAMELAIKNLMMTGLARVHVRENAENVRPMTQSSFR